ncbi:hypothetical protein OESDEN_06778 [Oesophagostomum dentatum]|uniref:SCP domain-containing protein n=1 Tax=Oesophagostomum dentatum TaxID=61180 RepID=A0A0B1TD78_OESDE|nr:hypothetical protein OESDEN_06778 [Oesophagostomum dentatum]
MFATLGLFLLGIALAVAAPAASFNDCNPKSEYRQDLFSSVAKANQDMEWDCELEKKALKGEKPTGNAFQLNVESSIPEGITPEIYIQAYPWEMYSFQVVGYEKFGCAFKKEKKENKFVITCHFSE